MQDNDELNPLQDIHKHLVAMSALFRQRVCEECNWSAPTFYRKMREKENKFSNAERDKILAVMQQITHEATNYFKRYS
ncbi:hypothetical protein DCC81_01860 [Chitinophaga parva]|uniref:Uncharacterized protein n=1 Tax=Chitinophaga parva TaxID=2169414 RepID=A0A2T7BKQ7_9BACT|nr:hypothetical protein [Chitinophaga parva]PUZ28255.1 hypothetical protein DCC81_01860 [Chitinophaga parva]